MNSVFSLGIAVFLGVFYISGVFGFLYETLFYIVNDGKLSRRGNCFGPWIQIYGWGGVTILLTTWGFRANPWMVLLIGGIGAGVLEFVTGYVLFHYMNGTRKWDYNTEKWNWGNVGGYICIRSIAVFALAGLILVYIVVPIQLFLKDALGNVVFSILMVVPGSLFFVDAVYNGGLSKVFGSMNAIKFYKEKGCCFLLQAITK